MCYEEEYIMLITIGSKSFIFVIFIVLDDEHRSQTRACATESSSRAAAAAQDRMGIRFADEQHHDRFNMIKNREVKTTKWACPIILNQLGMTNDFNLLCNRVGL